MGGLTFLFKYRTMFITWTKYEYPWLLLPVWFLLFLSESWDVNISWSNLEIWKLTVRTGSMSTVSFSNINFSIKIHTFLNGSVVSTENNNNSMFCLDYHIRCNCCLIRFLFSLFLLKKKNVHCWNYPSCQFVKPLSRKQKQTKCGCLRT